MLTPDQEIALSRQIQELVKLEQEKESLAQSFGRDPTEGELAYYSQLSIEELNRITIRARAAKNQMISANLRLVVSIAKKYQDRGLPLQDLIQEGAIGLAIATEKFKPELGYKFSTYAYWYIRQTITKGIINRSRTIRLPGHVYDKLNKIKKTTKNLSQSLGRKPTSTEIATAMNLSVDKLRFWLDTSAPLPSLDQLAGTQENTPIGDLLPDSKQDIEYSLINDELKENLLTVLKSLGERENEIICLRYGLIDGREKSIAEIASIYNISRSRVRQIESLALKKLRERKQIHLLKEYIA